MNSISNKRKSFSTAILLVAALSILIYARETGVTGKTRKNGEGCICHNISPSAGVIVTISGPDQVSVNEVASYTVSISGGPLVRGGTNIAVLRGSLNIVSSDLQKIDEELTHVAPKPPSGNSVSFQFTYTAPSTPGTDTIYANGNSVNFNGQELGDQWNFAPNKGITVTSATDINEEGELVKEFGLRQNYPNPFNPSTTISWYMKSGDYVRLSIYDLSGKLVKTLVDSYKPAGENFVTIDGTDLASGTYLYKIETVSFSEIKKMMLIK
jgi:hypothetical protein